ncbi:alpha/beta hydrolase [Butyrivibrio sp. AD3002]|uniref:alpha/beta hydrolase n=1 Tax=Butyrivibrio sp. AD3002 TaxID=1280670 RepID=UPI0003B406A3|nr:alpha/beta hydrolase [Butyrivibrio sp. AD3002]
MNPILEHLSKNAKKHAGKITLVLEENSKIPEDLDIFFDIEYRGKDGNTLCADIFKQKNNEKKLPIIVFAHGGGLFVGNRKVNRIFCEVIARLGYLVFSIDYRLLSETDGIGGISDVCSGLEFVTAFAEDYGGDPDKVILMGESAGAYLALYAAVVANSDILDGVIEKPETLCKVKGLCCSSGMFYVTRNDPIGMVYKKDMFGKRTKDKAFTKLTNPNNPDIISKLPPVFLVSSSGDFLRSYTLKFAKALEKEGHDHELIYYEKSNHLLHAFVSFAPLLPESAEVLARLQKWIANLG